MKKKVKIILFIIAAAALSYFLALTIIPVTVLSSTVNRHYSYENAAEPIGYETHFLTTGDWETVAIYEKIPSQPSAVMIFLSGMTGPSVQSFSNLGDVMVEHNIGAVLLEFRGHGESSGNLIGLGYLELLDTSAAIDWCFSEKKLAETTPILLCGVSMGASAALVACGELPEVDGVIAWSPYVSFEEQFELEAKLYGCPPLSRTYATSLVMKFLEKTYGEEVVRTLSPRSEAAKIGNRPVLICASSGDRSVTLENTERLEELLSNVTVKIRDSRNHLVVEGNLLENAAGDEELLEWIFDWLKESFRLGIIDNAA